MSRQLTLPTEQNQVDDSPSPEMEFPSPGGYEDGPGAVQPPSSHQMWIESSEGPLEYESDPEIWSQSDDTSLTGPEESLSEHGSERPISSKQKFNRQEKLRMLALRRHLDNLAGQVLEMEHNCQTAREELKKCRSKIEALESERDHVVEELEESQEEGNMANVHRLQNKYGKVETELAAERELERGIQHRLEKSELELSKAELERGKFVLAEEDLKSQEERLDYERGENAMQRARKENLKVVQAERRRRGREKDNMATVRERDRKHRQAMSAARRSREAAAKYLKETLVKVRQQEAEEEERQRQHLDQRMRTLLALRNDVAANRESIRAQQARSRFQERRARSAEARERQALEEAGENVELEVLRRRRFEQFEKERENYDSNQREKQVELLSNILKEERQMKKRQAMYPQLWAAENKRDRSKRVARKRSKPRVIRETSGSSSMEYSADVEEAAPQPVGAGGAKALDLSSDEDDFSPYGITSRDERGSDSEERHDELAKPEFEGLWMKEHKSYRVPKDEDSSYTLNYPSKMEKEIMAAALDKTRANIVKKQVAAGKEFKGCPFYSKPDVIHFKDFDVGKSYKKRVILTNVSYSVNFIKLKDISEHLKDFIDLQFDPPGQMSAGMSCDLIVTFKPMINEDLDGEVKFLTQTGPFNIPLRCTTKKCDLSVDTNLVDFGTQVIGETLKKTVVLTNKGAKGTNFEFIKTTGLNMRTITSAGTSLGRMTTPDTVVEPDPEEEPEPKSPKRKGKGKNKKGEKKEKPDKNAEKKKKEKEKEKEEEVVQPPTEELLAEPRPPTAKSRVTIDDHAEVLLDDEMEDLSGLDGMRVGSLAGGTIGPFSALKLEIIFQPTIPGKVDVDFEVRFDDPLSDVIHIKSFANAIDVPVWVERQNVDLKICMFDRLYQDAIVVNNRATTALRLKFEVCKELRNHMELLPKTAYIQAQSQFSAQLKFLPRHSLMEEAGSYFDKETSVLQAPMTIRVADQTAPVPFTIHAVVTNSDFEFDTDFIDFGFCTIYETVIATVKLSNKSILAHKFGFVNLPDYVDVQPNDGFGTLLPLETIELDILFSAKKAKEYSFELTCKSGINREFKISCKGVGVHPPLDLSHSTIHFAATALDDSSIATLHVMNTHTNANEFTHPVPRIGKGDIAPVGPTSFEFVVPEDSPLSIYPSVGTVRPGKKTMVSIKFNPHLTDGDIRKESVRLVTKTMEAKAKQEWEEIQLAAKKSQEGATEEEDNKKGKKGPKKAKSPTGRNKKGGSPPLTGPREVVPPQPEDIKPGSDEYSAGKASLLRQYTGQFNSYSIPCYVASGELGDPGTLSYDVHNCLFVEVHCPTVKPSLVVISDHGRTTTNFGDVSVGQRVIKSVTIQNISDKPLDLKSSILGTGGPFSVLNSLRPLQPDATHTIIVAFAPEKDKVFYETLDIMCATSTLTICFTGQGISPTVNVSLKEPILDMGYTIVDEETVETFKIENASSLAVDYRIHMDSQSFHKRSSQKELPAFLKRGDPSLALMPVGTANVLGTTVFDCVPAEGTLEPGGKQEITVTFRPDHPSDYFADVARIELYNKHEAHSIVLKGVCKSKIMYILGGDDIKPSVESLAVVPQPEEPVEVDTKTPPVPIPMLLTFRAMSTEEETTPAAREIKVGCIRTNAVSQKKNGEFFFDNLTMVTPKGFQIEPQKGMVEAGAYKTVKITWAPPKGHDPNMPIESNAILNVKGETLERFNVLLRAQVVTEEQQPL